MFLAFGVVCALVEARGSGRGQVVDAAMTDGVGLLDGDDLQPEGERPLARRAAGQRPRRRRAVLRRLSLRRRQVGRRRRAGAAVLRRARRQARARRRRVRRPLESSRLAGAQGAARSGLRRGGRATNGRRCSPIRTPASRRSSTSTRRRAIPHNVARADLRRRRRRAATRAGAALLAHAGRNRPPAALRSAPMARRSCAKAGSRTARSKRCAVAARYDVAARSGRRTTRRGDRRSIFARLERGRYASCPDSSPFSLSLG